MTMQLLSKPIPLSLTERANKCRITWTIGGSTGHGEWHHIADRNPLDDLVVSMNAQYGAGTHTLEIYKEQS